MSVKKVKQSRKGNKDARNSPRVRDCACVRVYGAKWCVAQYDSERDEMLYVGIPCRFCGKKITRWEGEWNACDECIAAEQDAWNRNVWYAETVWCWSTPMHQEITEYRNLEQELDELLGTTQ